MGWSVIACICGFLGCWRWQQLGDDSAKSLWAIIAIAGVSVGLFLWATLGRDAQTFGQIVDALQHGSVARFLLGLILGIGTAFIVVERSRGQPGNGDTDYERRVTHIHRRNDGPFDPWPLGLSRGTGNGGSANDLRKNNLPTFLLAAAALGIVILAMIAPHVDDWLRRATALKSPYVELQLASVSSHKISVSENLDAFYDEEALHYLTQYEDRIQKDLDYQKYKKKQNDGQADAKIDSYLYLTAKLLPTFKMVITPVAKCVQTAIKQGSLSIDSARDAIRPIANLAEQIILSEDLQNAREKLEEKHHKFWQSVVDLPTNLQLPPNVPDCQKVPYRCGGEIICTEGSPLDTKKVFPVIQDYKTLPYLYVAAALLISFTADDERALQVLEEADETETENGATCSADNDTNCDYLYLSILARLKYYQGRPGDIWHAYLEPLDKLVAVAQRRIEFLELNDQRCKAESDQLCRHQSAELIARNMTAYFIAEDVARGYADAKQHLAQLQEDTEEIKRLVDASDKRKWSSEHDAFDEYIQKYRDTFLDTYAFATLVLEAQRASPDYDMIEANVIPELNEAVDHFKGGVEQKEHGSPQERHIDRVDLAQWRIMQEHLAAAHEFVGER